MLRIKINHNVKNVRRYLLMFSGLASMLGCTITMLMTIIYAFFKGGTATITINNYNEMWIEVFLVPVILVLSSYTIYHFYKNIPTTRTEGVDVDK
jgi:hypothetical protein